MMKPNSDGNEHALFSGLVFWGSEFLAGDLILSLESIRNWAFEQNLIWDVETQLMASERIEELKKHFVPQDQLAVLIQLYKHSSGNLCYLEYPYPPIKSLIKKAKEIQIVYWQMRPTAWNVDGSVKDYGEVSFGFWYPSIGDEFCSMSNAKLVVKKFYDLFHQLSDIYEKNILTEGTLDVAVDGAVKAKFFKTGRLFDVQLKWIRKGTS